MKQCYMLLMTD